MASNFVWAYPLRSTRSEETLTALKILISFTGRPKIIQSDGGSAFRDRFATFCQTHQISHHRASSRSQAMGLAEQKIGFIKGLLNSFVFSLVASERKKWDEYIGLLLDQINHMPVYPRENSKTRKQMFYSVFNCDYKQSRFYLEDLKKALQNLKSHREQRLDNLKDLDKLPKIEKNDVVFVKRSKHEVPVVHGSRSLLPSVTDLYIVLQVNETSARIQSLISGNSISLSLNKIEKLTISQLEEVRTLPGLAETSFQKNLFDRRRVTHKLLFNLASLTTNNNLEEEEAQACRLDICNKMLDAHIPEQTVESNDSSAEVDDEEDNEVLDRIPETEDNVINNDNTDESTNDDEEELEPEIINNEINDEENFNLR